MKTALTLFTAVFLIASAGRGPEIEGKKQLFGKKKPITVKFQQGRTLQYRFVSSRDIEIDWGAMKSGSKAGQERVDKSSESMEMVVAYTPTKIDPNGLTTIEAVCKSVNVRRSSSAGAARQGAGKDAVESLAGANFTFTVEPTGKIEDYSQLEKLIKDTGEKAFRPEDRRGRIKEPDMIGDFTATQWFLWDPISSMENAAKGIRVGQSWKSKLPITTPMVTRKARDVTYTLDEIRQTDEGRLAVIRSSCSPAESVPDNWPPMPYSEGFQMSGKFGFLTGYHLLDLQGQGEELFDIDAGRIERDNQQYQSQWEASFPWGIGGKLPITIKQNLTMELLK